MAHWFDELSSQATLRAAVVRIAARSEQQGRLDRLLRSDADGVAASIASALARRESFWRPAKERWVMLDRKRRLIELELPDRVLNDAMAELLRQRIEPLYSRQLFSYRRKHSSSVALRSFLDYLAAHRRQHTDRRQRGVFVLRTDVKSYGDTIPVAPTSPLWSDLAPLLPAEDDYQRALLRHVISPTVQRDDDGGEASPLVGVSIGSPLGTLLTNLYLMPLDRRMAELPCYYARYGDDLLVAHPEREHVDRATRQIEELLAARGLRLSPDKTQLCFFNGAGRRAAVASDVPGRAQLDYLGTRIDFTGTLALPSAKLKFVLDDLRTRLRAADHLLGGAARVERARALAAVVRAAWSPDPGVADRHAPWLQHRVSDRAQLRQLDYLVALAIAELLSGLRGVRAFRLVPYRWLRSEAGLPSLVVMRNRGDDGEPAR